MEGRFELRPDVKYPHLGATTLPNLGAKLHLGAIRNELVVHCGREKEEHLKGGTPKMKTPNTKLGLVSLLFAFIIGCATAQGPVKRQADVCDNWFSCQKIIKERKGSPEVQEAKKSLEQIAFQMEDHNAYYAFISLVPESLRHSEAMERYKQLLSKIVSQFTQGKTDQIRRDDFIPSPRIFAPGSQVTLGGNFTKLQMKCCDIYSWPTAPLQIKGEVEGFRMISGEAIILNYDNGFVYVRGCDFIAGQRQSIGIANDLSPGMGIFEETSRKLIWRGMDGGTHTLQVREAGTCMVPGSKGLEGIKPCFPISESEKKF